MKNAQGIYETHTFITELRRFLRIFNDLREFFFPNFGKQTYPAISIMKPAANYYSGRIIKAGTTEDDNRTGRLHKFEPPSTTFALSSGGRVGASAWRAVI